MEREFLHSCEVLLDLEDLLNFVSLKKRTFSYLMTNQGSAISTNINCQQLLWKKPKLFSQKTSKGYIWIKRSFFRSFFCFTLSKTPYAVWTISFKELENSSLETSLQRFFNEKPDIWSTHVFRSALSYETQPLRAPTVFPPDIK